MYWHISTYILCLTATLFFLPSVGQMRGYRKFLVCFAILAILNIPFFGLPVMGYIRGLLGDPSITTAVTALLFLISRLLNRTLVPPQLPRLMGTVFGLIALVFYPMSLGAAAFDPYWLGFQPKILIVITLIVSVLAILRGYLFIALLLSCVMLAYGFNMMESSNYWDYLMDPIFAIYGITCLVRHAYRFLLPRLTTEGFWRQKIL